MATSRRVSFLAVTSVGVGAVLGLGGCATNPYDLSACIQVSDASKETLVRGQCYVFHAPERRGEIRTYSVYVDSELRVIARGCGGGGGGGGGGGEKGNGGGGGGGSNFGSDAVSLPASSANGPAIEINVGKGGRGLGYRSIEPQCVSGSNLPNHGCAGERGESTLITAKDFRFEFKGGEGGSGGANMPDFNAGIGGKSVRWGGDGGKGGAAMRGAGNSRADTISAYGVAGERSIDLFGSSPGKGGAWAKRGDIALAGGGGGGGGFHYSLKKDKERGKGGDGANSSLSDDPAVIGRDAEAGGYCAGGGGGAGWEGTPHHSRGGDGGDGLLILDLR